MAQETLLLNPKEIETGKNALELLKFLKDEAFYFGPARPLIGAFRRQGLIRTPEKERAGIFDDIAEVFKDTEGVLLRQNPSNFNVFARWYEIAQDGSVITTLGNYFCGLFYMLAEAQNRYKESSYPSVLDNIQEKSNAKYREELEWQFQSRVQLELDKEAHNRALELAKAGRPISVTVIPPYQQPCSDGYYRGSIDGFQCPTYITFYSSKDGGVKMAERAYLKLEKDIREILDESQKTERFYVEGTKGSERLSEDTSTKIERKLSDYKNRFME